MFGGRNADRSDFAVSDISLDGIETSVLRCLTQIDDGSVLTPGELSVRIKRPGSDLKKIINRLSDLELIESASDRLTEVKGFRIAPAGQMYLLGA